MSVHIKIRVLSLVMFPFNRFVRLLPPSLQWMPWPPLTGSPAVLHLPQYYGVVRLLPDPSALPPVDPWLHVPPDPFPEAVLLVWEVMGSSLRFLGHPCGGCAALASPASRPDLAIAVAAGSCLRVGYTRRPGNDRGFRECTLTACCLAVYASHPPVAR